MSELYLMISLCCSYKYERLRDCVCVAFTDSLSRGNKRFLSVLLRSGYISTGLDRKGSGSESGPAHGADGEEGPVQLMVLMEMRVRSSSWC
ncbi:hypothetical protein NQZ68_027105 [Dissostichus eleginoides]|nr:hypothetical protein NQZ68_027105 [Dissostichus eleginoides]